MRHKPVGGSLLDGDDRQPWTLQALRHGTAIPGENDERAKPINEGVLDTRRADGGKEGQVTQRPDYIYRVKVPRIDTPKRRGFASKARHAVTRRLARTFPTVRAAIRVADPTEAMLERTHTLLASVQLALGSGALDSGEIRRLEAEASKLRSQAEVLLEVVRDLTD